MSGEAADAPQGVHDGQSAHTLAAGLAVVGVTALIVATATASDGVAGVAHVVAAVALAAAGLVELTVLVLRPTPLPATAVPAGAGGLAALDADGLALLDREVRHTLRDVTDAARAHERRATGLLAFGALALLVAQPALWLTGDPELLPAGETGTVALLLVLVAPVLGLALCRVVLGGEWEPPRARPPVAPPGGADAARRTLVARRVAALAVGEVVEARRRRLADLMAWLAGIEVGLVVVVTLARIGQL